MVKKRRTKAQRAAIKKARAKWMGMSKVARRKAMPAKTKPRKVYPVGKKLMIDVGRPGGHYQYVQKTKYGWKKIRAPKRILKAGWKRVKKGYVKAPKEYKRKKR